MDIQYDTDGGAGSAARLGLIVLSTDETLEFEARQLLAGRDVSLAHTRIKAEADVTPETLAMMEGRLTDSAALLPSELDVIGYACTSASTVIGPARVAERIRAVHPDATACNPISAVMAALGALEVRTLAYVSPYVPEVTAPMRAMLAENGFQTVSERSFGESDDRTVARICESSTRALIEQANTDEADAVFVSCTNLRSFGLIDEAEAALGKPVISSNLALLWHMLEKAGADASGWGPGRLFRLRDESEPQRASA